jgi:hypothetical protein
MLRDNDKRYTHASAMPLYCNLGPCAPASGAVVEGWFFRARDGSAPVASPGPRVVVFCLRNKHAPVLARSTPPPSDRSWSKGTVGSSPTLQDCVLEEAPPGGVNRMLDRSKLLYSVN